jgi:hypothetical protein
VGGGRGGSPGSWEYLVGYGHREWAGTYSESSSSPSEEMEMWSSVLGPDVEVDVPAFGLFDWQGGEGDASVSEI